MIRKAIIGGDLGAALGAAVGIVWAITDDFATPDMTQIVQAFLVYGVIWISIGTGIGLIVGAIDANGITLRRVVLGFLGTVGVSSCVGLLWIVTGWVAEAWLPSQVFESGPNLSVGGDAMIASALALAAANIGFLIWTSVAMGQRRVFGALMVAATVGACFLLSTRKLPVRADFRWNLRQRETVVGLARAGKLAPDPLAEDAGWQVLPRRYRQLSEGGTVWIQRAHGNMTVVFYRYVEGTCLSAFYYESNDHAPEEAPRDRIRKLAPHWYFASECD